MREEIGFSCRSQGFKRIRIGRCRMLTRRKLIMGAVATALVGLGATLRATSVFSPTFSTGFPTRSCATTSATATRTAAGTATTGTTADTATRRTSTAATGLRNITASRRRSPRSARSRIRIPATGTMTTMMTTTVAAPASTSLGMTGAEGPDPGGRGLPETSRRQRLRRGVRCLSLGRL